MCRPKKRLLEYLSEIPKTASQQDLFMAEGKASERFSSNSQNVHDWWRNSFYILHVHNLRENNKHPPSRFRPYQFLLEHTGLTHAQFGKMRGKGTVILKPFIIPLTLESDISTWNNEIETFYIRWPPTLRKIIWSSLASPGWRRTTPEKGDNNDNNGDNDGDKMIIMMIIAWLEKNCPEERFSFHFCSVLSPSYSGQWKLATINSCM